MLDNNHRKKVSPKLLPRQLVTLSGLPMDYGAANINQQATNSDYKSTNHHVTPPFSFNAQKRFPIHAIDMSGTRPIKLILNCDRPCA